MGMKMMLVKGTGSPEVPPRQTHRPAMRAGDGTFQVVGIGPQVPQKVVVK